MWVEDHFTVTLDAYGEKRIEFEYGGKIMTLPVETFWATEASVSSLKANFAEDSGLYPIFDDWQSRGILK